MSEQIDSLIFQFEYLTKQKMPGGQRVFQDRMQRFFETCPTGFRYGIETRNQTYLNDGYFGVLRALGLTHVFPQGYWMPSIFSLYERFHDYIQDFCVIRLHGPDRKGIEKKAKKKWEQIIDPKDDELQSLAEMVHDLIVRDIHVTLNINNHYKGSAPMSIERFVDLFLKGAFGWETNRKRKRALPTVWLDIIFPGIFNSRLRPPWLWSGGWSPLNAPAVA